jgi:hypothetical protein
MVGSAVQAARSSSAAVDGGWLPAPAGKALPSPPATSRPTSSASYSSAAITSTPSGRRRLDRITASGP